MSGSGDRDIPLYTITPILKKNSIGNYIDQPANVNDVRHVQIFAQRNPASVETRILNWIWEFFGFINAVLFPTLVDLETGQTVPVKKSLPFFMVTISILELYFWNLDKVENVFCYDPYRRHETWRNFTVMFAHTTAAHIWWNIGYQVILGFLLEAVHHWKRICYIYIGGVIGGTLAVSVFTPKIYLMGCSAGVFALFGANLAALIMNWQEMKWKRCQLGFWVLYIVCQTYKCTRNIIAGHVKIPVSNAAHFWGFFVGFLIRVCILRTFRMKLWKTRFQKICFGILISLSITAILLMLVFLSIILNQKIT